MSLVRCTQKLLKELRQPSVAAFLRPAQRPSLLEGKETGEMPKGVEI
jgi:hypothetical protein